MISQHIEDLPGHELARRAAAFFSRQRPKTTRRHLTDGYLP